MRNPDLMTPSEVLEAVIRAATEAKRQVVFETKKGVHEFSSFYIDADIFIQALRKEIDV